MECLQGKSCVIHTWALQRWRGSLEAPYKCSAFTFSIYRYIKYRGILKQWAAHLYSTVMRLRRSTCFPNITVTFSTGSNIVLHFIIFTILPWYGMIMMVIWSVHALQSMKFSSLCQFPFSLAYGFLPLKMLYHIHNKNLAIANRSRVSCINTNNNIIPWLLKSSLEVTQGHWKWYYLKAWVRFPIRLL